MQHGAAAELLARTPLFRGVEGESLTAILRGGELQHYEAGQLIAVAGTTAETTFFILDGEVELRDTEARRVHSTLQPGMFLNQMAMFVETTNLFSAIALDRVVVLSLPPQSIAHAIFRQPYLAGIFAGNIRTELAATARTLHELERELEESMNGLPHCEADVEPAPGANGHDLVDGPAREFVESDIPCLPELEMMNGPGMPAPGVHPGGSMLEGGEDVRGAEVETQQSFWSKLQVTDLLAELRSSNDQTDRTRPEPERDRTASPSPAPRRQREARRTHVSGQGLPIYDQAGVRGSIVANPVHGNSTK